MGIGELSDVHLLPLAGRFKSAQQLVLSQNHLQNRLQTGSNFSDAGNSF